MRRKRVEEIILPYQGEVPLDITVQTGDRIVDAIEAMLDNNKTYIAVVRNRQPIGMVRLEDAFRKLGLQVPLGK